METSQLGNPPHMSESFKLINIPMPPSSNVQYAARSFPGRHAKNFNGDKRANFSLARICPTSELEKFEKQIKNEWARETVNNIALHKVRALIRGWIMRGLYVDVRTFACFPYFSIHTKEGLARKMDGTNRIKALHDCLAELLEVDDSWFWDSSVRKVETKREVPYCIVVFRPTEHLTVDQLKERGEI